MTCDRTIGAVLFLLIYSVKELSCLKCFLCSDFDPAKQNTLDCPVNSTDVAVWATFPQRYSDRVSNTEPVNCAVGYDGNNGKVYYQVSKSALNPNQN